MGRRRIRRNWRGTACLRPTKLAAFLGDARSLPVLASEVALLLPRHTSALTYLMVIASLLN